MTIDNMPYRILGHTGERVSAIGVGGWHLGLKPVTEKLAIEIVRRAIDGGVVQRAAEADEVFDLRLA